MFNLGDERKEFQKSYEHLYAALAMVILQYSKNGTVHIPLSLVSELSGKKFDIITFTDNISGDVVIQVRKADHV